MYTIRHVYYIIHYYNDFAPVTFCKVFNKQENGICFPAEKYLQSQIKVEKKKNIAKEKNENRETTLNISHNSPRILIAEKTTKKKPFSA
jgi:hypothetical protein